MSLIFFYPVWMQNKVPLPVDALVGAHVPWTELAWEEYPAGIPIKNQEITDSFSQFYPWRNLVGEFWRAGKAPLWNPYMFSGTPFLATLHSASLYPLNILYLFLSNLSAWTGLIFLQIFLAGVFMYLFLDELRLKKEASFLGGIAFAFSGYMIAWLEFATGGHAGLWLPLLLLFLLKLVRSEKITWIVPISILFFFVFTAGDFQVPLYITLAYILFGAYLLFQKKNWRQFFFRKALPVIAGLIFGVLLSLPQLLPTIELFAQSVRVDDSYIQEYFFGLMHWEKVVNFIWPDFFGNVVTRNYWGKFGYHEYLSFVGIVPLVFATASFFVKKLKHEKFFWILLAISLVFLFPTPLALLPYKLKLPGLGTSSASRIIFLVDFCLVVLAAHGFSKWTEDRWKLGRIILYFLVITFGVGLGLIYCIYYIQSGTPGVSPQIFINLKVALRNMIPSSLVLTALGLFVIIQKTFFQLKYQWLGKIYKFLLPILFLTVASTELLRFAWKNTPFSPKEFVFPKTKIISFLQEQKQPFRIAGGIPLNLFMPFKLSSAEGYDPIYPKRNSEWFSLVNSGNLNALSGRYGLIHSFPPSLLDYANVKYVIDYKKNIYGGISERGAYASGVEFPRYKEVFAEGRIKVFKNENVLPRVWMSMNYKVSKTEDKLIGNLLSVSVPGDREIILESEPKIAIEKNNLKYSLTNYSQDFNNISFEVESSDNGLLFISESFYPGWSAFVDNQEVEIFKANYIFQAIQVPKGIHEIKFIYDPNSFKIGKAIFFATATFLSGIILYEKRYKKSKKTS